MNRYYLNQRLWVRVHQGKLVGINEDGAIFPSLIIATRQDNYWILLPEEAWMHLKISHSMMLSKTDPKLKTVSRKLLLQWEKRPFDIISESSLDGKAWVKAPEAKKPCFHCIRLEKARLKANVRLVDKISSGN